MKVLVTGVNGMLGRSVAKALLHSPEYNVAGLARNKQQEIGNISYHYLDLTNLAGLEKMIGEISPDAIIHCAANVNVNDCDVHKEYAYNLHVKVSEVLSTCKTANKFVYISTDSVYDGKNGNFKETDAPSPVNYYAQTKLEGEQAVLGNSKNAVIARTNIYGVMNPFKNSLAEWAINSLLNRQAIKGFDDVFFNPLFVGQLANGIIKLLQSNIEGIVNLGCAEQISKFEFLQKIAKAFQFDESLIESSSISTTPALSNRPKNTTLNTHRMQNSLQVNYSINDGIGELYSEYKKLYL
jgi:dTDP-4-dehydrorhamnose reductase